MSQGLSRRKFVRTSGMVAAGALAASALATPQTKGEGVSEYQGIGIERKNQVATITLGRVGKANIGTGNRHWDLGEVFNNLRGDNTVRVIVLTWEEGGGLPHPGVPSNEIVDGGADPKRAWETFTGLVRCHEAMISIEKPIVARVNGDTVGFNSSITFASDIIVAREDAILADHHLAPVQAPSGLVDSRSVVPGDGGAAWVPLYMSPAKAKEYLMLSKPYPAKELAQLGIINYAVPVGQLDKTVNDIVERLLQVAAYSLAWTKRVVNMHYLERMTNSLNAAAAYETVGFLQLAKLGYKSPTTLA